MDFKNILTAFFLFSVMVLNALTNEEIFRKALKKYENNDTVHYAEFTQSNFWRELDAEKVSKGELIYSDKGVVINYFEPDRQMLRYNDENITVTDYNEKTVLRMDNDGSVDFRPAEIISKIADNFSSAENKKNFTSFILKVKEDSDLIAAECDIDEKFSIIRIEYTDIDSNRVEFKFTEKRMNKKKLEDKYKVEVPFDFKVIQQ